MKIDYYLDSGANIHSKYKGSVTLDELGLTLEEWNVMTPDDKDEYMKDIVFQTLEWGYSESE